MVVCKKGQTMAVRLNIFLSSERSRASTGAGRWHAASRSVKDARLFTLSSLYSISSPLTKEGRTVLLRLQRFRI